MTGRRTDSRQTEHSSSEPLASTSLSFSIRRSRSSAGVAAASGEREEKGRGTRGRKADKEVSVWNIMMEKMKRGGGRLRVREAGLLPEGRWFKTPKIWVGGASKFVSLSPPSINTVQVPLSKALCPQQLWVYLVFW